MCPEEDCFESELGGPPVKNCQKEKRDCNWLTLHFHDKNFAGGFLPPTFLLASTLLVGGDMAKNSGPQKDT